MMHGLVTKSGLKQPEVRIVNFLPTPIKIAGKDIRLNVRLKDAMIHYLKK
jgi:hypothetical protein